jgi:immune inhibitor A
MKFCHLAWFLSLGFALATVGPGRSLARPADQPTAAQAAPDLMPLDPEIVSSYRAAGRPVPFSSAESRFADRPNVRINRIARPTALATNAANAASATNVKAIVLLVQFTDNPPGGPTARYNATVWDSMLFRDNYIRGGADTTTTRTLKSFFNSISYGAIDVVTLNLPSAVGWLTAPNNYAYYCQADGTHDNGFGPYPRNVQRLVMDAVIAADPYVDFSQYAVGGVVQNLFIVHAGSGAEWSGGSSLIWSHAWSVIGGDDWGNTAPLLYADGVLIDSYSMEPEAGGNTMGEGGGVSGPFLPTVGVYAHEFGHVLGLPDEYDYGYQSQGTGSISLMAGGCWNQTPSNCSDCAGNSPARPSAWGMAYLGFVTPTVVTTPTTGITIPPIETTGPGSIYKLVQPGSGGKEYWLFENRQQIGFDMGFSRMGTTAHGLCIYHVDENVMSRTFWRPNEAECVSGGVYAGQRNCDCATLPANSTNGEKWYGISVEQADGLYDLERNYANGAADFYPNTTGKTSFTPSTAPNSSSYYSVNACAGLVAATNIQEVGGNIILDLTGDVRTYTLGVALVGGGSVDRTPDLVAYQHGSTVTLEALPEAGFSFSGWSDDTTGSANPITLTMYADKSVTATFAALPCTLGVTVVGSGSVGRAPDLAGYVYGSTVTLEALPEAGYSFSGWSGDTTGSANPITLTMYANKSATATFVVAVPTSVGDRPVVALALALEPARPSPMRGTGRIGFVLPREARARLSVLDLQGREVAVLADGVFPAGRHTAMWDGSTERGLAPAGLYFVRLSAEGRVFSQRLVRLR